MEPKESCMKCKAQEIIPLMPPSIILWESISMAISGEISYPENLEKKKKELNQISASCMEKLPSAKIYL